MKTYWGMAVEPHSFLTATLEGGERSASLLVHFSCGQRAPGTHATGGWVDQTAGLEVSEKIKASFQKLYTVRRNYIQFVLTLVLSTCVHVAFQVV
jgi:hypothetical protein